MTPEAKARANVDRLPEQAGWTVQNADALNFTPAPAWRSADFR